MRLAAAIAALLISIPAAAAPEWVARSNVYAEQVLDDAGRFRPEFAARTGRDKFDTAVADLGPGYHERALAQAQRRVAALKRALADEKDVRVRQDLEILIDTSERNIASRRLRHEMLLEYVDAAGTVMFGLSSLLDARNPPERQARALVRMRRYAGLEPGYEPIAKLARERTEEELARTGLIGPYADEVKQSLANVDLFLKGIAQLFERDRIDGWRKDYDVLAAQLRDYRGWLERTVLPRARPDVKLPRELYVDSLRQAGVDMSPEELIERAGADFQETRTRLRLLAARIAAERGLPSSDYRDVIRALKREQIAPGEMVDVYRKRLRQVEDIIRREKLVTLPERSAAIRPALESEAAATPAPHMQAPRLLGNTGEHGEFVIVTSNPHAKSGAPMDDFGYDAATWTLTAHEARPGHELQFDSMVERGVSITRAVFAFNSANAEGWGLYSEAIMFPYMPPEAQLVALQFRLLRAARALLDPMVNLGLVTHAEAKRVLLEDVVLSEPFAQEEADRFAFGNPGQATSYFYGFQKLLALRTRVEIALGPRFDAKAFHDFILDQGLLPPALLEHAVLEEFVPARR